MTQPFIPGFENEERRRDLSQFYTPADVAERMARWARIPANGRVLEPSAGRGSLVIAAALVGAADILAFDVDPANVGELQQLFRRQLVQRSDTATHLNIEIRARDFLAAPAEPGYDVSLLNPPFEDDGDINFCAHALDFAARDVALLPSRVRHSKGRYEKFWRWHDPTRQVEFSERPQFGGEHSPMTDFCLMEIVRRKAARRAQETSTVTLEWW